MCACVRGTACVDAVFIHIFHARFSLYTFGFSFVLSLLLLNVAHFYVYLHEKESLNSKTKSVIKRMLYILLYVYIDHKTTIFIHRIMAILSNMISVGTPFILHDYFSTCTILIRFKIVHNE